MKEQTGMTNLHQIFEQELLKDEKILWAGQPNTNYHFAKMDIFLVPFSLLWCFMPVTAFFASLVNPKESNGTMDLLLIPFLVVGIYVTVGRFFVKFWKKKRTYYAVTNKRIIAIKNTITKNTEATYIRDIPCVNKTIRGNGNGSIIFGNYSFYNGAYQNTGLEIFGTGFGGGPISFFDIDDAKEVADLVNDLMHDLKV